MAGKRTRIYVTEKLIKAGIQMHSCRCPVALAITAAGGVDPIVGGDKVNVSHLVGGTIEEFYIDLPAKAAAFIKRFDVGSRVKPFSFELELP